MKWRPKWTIATIALAIVLVAGMINGFREDLVEPYSIMIGVVLVILGAVIGIMNIKRAEQVAFMVSSLVLLGIGITGVLTIIPTDWGQGAVTTGFILQSLFGYLITLVSPIALITAGKVMYQTGKD